MSIFENKKIFLIDHKGKSVAIFFKIDFPEIKSSYIKDLINFSKQKKNIDVRICMHKNRNLKIQNMINLVHKKKKYLFHKHKSKEEVYHVIKGEMKIEYIFNSKLKGVKLNKNSPIFRMDKNIFHRIKPLSKYVIFHEIRQGPFSGSDSIFKK
jgi:cupin fold WbuC family metalloprotein